MSPFWDPRETADQPTLPDSTSLSEGIVFFRQQSQFQGALTIGGTSIADLLASTQTAQVLSADQPALAAVPAPPDR